MVGVYLETSVLAWPEPALGKNSPEGWEPWVSAYVFEELENLPDSLEKTELSRRARLYPVLEPVLETQARAEELTRLLAQSRRLPPQLLRHLAMAASANLAALITLDPELLALPVALTLKASTQDWPLVARPESLTWPEPANFELWAQKTRQELARATQRLNPAAKTRLAEKWREGPEGDPQRTPGPAFFEEDLADLNPRVEGLSLSQWLGRWRRRPL
ncbi:MAG: hypothetical protein LBR11_01380 [Deltaproteobacteria bacterium]|jgi:hypothetical protein|nr:hypothetical protein [Deltaproteobacteria bacterium]